MKKKYFLLLLLWGVEISFSQYEYETGYIVTNNGEKKKCLINNKEWKNNPEIINYKADLNSPEKKAGIDDIREFGIGDAIKYKRFEIEVDKSSDDINNLDKNRAPKFVKETAFLKSLVEGKASLYAYNNKNVHRFFYSVDDKPVTQLIYKLYLFEYTGKGSWLRKNEQFKQQLINDLKCPEITENKIVSLRYKENDLKNIFTKYNRCTNSEFVVYGKKKKGKFLNIYANISLNSSSLSLSHPLFQSRGNTLDTELSPGLGFEIEFILPYNKNKWGIFLKPVYNVYNTKYSAPFVVEHNDFDEDINDVNLITEVQYKSIEFISGIRYYMFLNKNNKIYLNSALVIDNPMSESYILFSRDDGYYIDDRFIDIRSKVHLMYSLGYSTGKYSVDFTYYSPRNISNFSAWHSEFNKLSLGVRYKLN